VIRYLVASIWPAGIAALAAAAFMLVRRDTSAARPSGPGGGRADAAGESARFGAVAVAGALCVFGLMCALGVIVVHQGLTIDRPIFNWMSKHQVHKMAAVMRRLTKLGDTWTTWGAALAAAACLAVTWRTRRWLPPVVLVTAIVSDHFATLALRHVFHRVGPPASPLGTYPSGGCDRVIVFYGLIAYLLWREFSGKRRTAIVAGAAIAALGFNEAYSRVYLSLHWFTDAVSGLLYGRLLLAIFIIAVHFAAGRLSQPMGRPVGLGLDSSRTVTASQVRYVTDVCSLLWPSPAGASLISRRAAARGRSAGADGDLIVLPGMRSPRLIVPSGRRAGAAALRRYGEPGSARTKLATRTLAVMLASGLAPALGDRLALDAADGAPTIGSYLTETLGQPVRISMHVGADRANRKPVLQLLTPAGDTIGYAKIGINRLTADLVKAEHAALVLLGAAGLAGLRPPRALSLGRWNELDVLIVSALPVWLRRVRLTDARLAAALAELADSAGTSPATFATSDYLGGLASRLAQVSDGADRLELRRLVIRLADAAGDTKLNFGCWHGDLTPWNLANTRAGLLVWDWERFGLGVPVGFDMLHYWLQARVVRTRTDPAAAAARCVASAPDLLRPFGVSPAEAKLTALAYLAELSVRYLADRQADAGARLGAPGGWLIPAIGSALDSGTARV